MMMMIIMIMMIIIIIMIVSNLWTGRTGHFSKSQDYLFGFIKHLLY